MFARSLRYGRLPVVLIASALLLGAGPLQALPNLNMVGPDRGYQQVSRSDPSLDEKFARNGRPRSAQEVGQITIGTPRTAVAALLGEPVQSKGEGQWDFNVKLPLNGREQIVCQYRVLFDKEGKVRATQWRRAQCADAAQNGPR